MLIMFTGQFCPDEHSHVALDAAFGINCKRHDAEYVTFACAYALHLGKLFLGPRCLSELLS